MAESLVNNFEVPSWAGKPPPGLHLDVIKETKMVQKLMIDEKKCYFFGRNKQLCDFSIDHASSSRVHAALVWHKHLNRPFIIDLGSTHGTFIGKLRLDSKKPQQVPIDSQIHFGASTRIYIIRERPQNKLPDGKDDLDTSTGNTSGIDLPENELELDNLTEFNTAHNRRIAGMGGEISDAPQNSHRNSRKKKNQALGKGFADRRLGYSDIAGGCEGLSVDSFNGYAFEDIDPSIGRFRNLVQTTVIPKKMARLEMGAGGSSSDNQLSNRNGHVAPLFGEAVDLDLSDADFAPACFPTTTKLPAAYSQVNSDTAGVLDSSTSYITEASAPETETHYRNGISNELELEKGLEICTNMEERSTNFSSCEESLSDKLGVFVESDKTVPEKYSVMQNIEEKQNIDGENLNECPAQSSPTEYKSEFNEESSILDECNSVNPDAVILNKVVSDTVENVSCNERDQKYENYVTERIIEGNNESEDDRPEQIVTNEFSTSEINETFNTNLLSMKLESNSTGDDFKVLQSSDAVNNLAEKPNVEVDSLSFASQSPETVTREVCRSDEGEVYKTEYINTEVNDTNKIEQSEDLKTEDSLLNSNVVISDSKNAERADDELEDDNAVLSVEQVKRSETVQSKQQVLVTDLETLETSEALETSNNSIVEASEELEEERPESSTHVDSIEIEEIEAGKDEIVSNQSENSEVCESEGLREHDAGIEPNVTDQLKPEDSESQEFNELKVEINESKGLRDHDLGHEVKNDVTSHLNPEDSERQELNKSEVEINDPGEGVNVERNELNPERVAAFDFFPVTEPLSSEIVNKYEAVNENRIDDEYNVENSVTPLVEKSTNDIASIEQTNHVNVDTVKDAEINDAALDGYAENHNVTEEDYAYAELNKDVEDMCMTNKTAMEYLDSDINARGNLPEEFNSVYEDRNVAAEETTVEKFAIEKFAEETAAEETFNDDALEDDDELIQSIVNSTMEGLNFLTEPDSLAVTLESTLPANYNVMKSSVPNYVEIDEEEKQRTEISVVDNEYSAEVFSNSYDLTMDQRDISTSALEPSNKAVTDPDVNAKTGPDVKTVSGLDDRTIIEPDNGTNLSLSSGSKPVAGSLGGVVGAKSKVKPTNKSAIKGSTVSSPEEWQGLTTALQAMEAAQARQETSQETNDNNVAAEAIEQRTLSESSTPPITPPPSLAPDLSSPLPQGIPASPVIHGPPLCSNLAIPITQLGKLSPVWLPDSEASSCMECETSFSFTRRRHHCRACGKVNFIGYASFAKHVHKKDSRRVSSCCNIKHILHYLDNKEGRVCSKCYQDLIRALCYEKNHPDGSAGRPNPNNPDEYCSTVPPPLQAMQADSASPLSVMVPTGVLRKRGSVRQNEPKQVMFSDGIRPGGDLTELDGTPDMSRIPSQTSSRRTKRVDKLGSRSPKTKTVREPLKTQNFLPADGGLPPIINSDLNGASPERANPTQEHAMDLIRKSNHHNPVTFSVNLNLNVMVTILNLSCCVNRRCWCFSTRGMCTVSQDEIVILLECLQDEDSVPVDVLRHLASLYDEAGQGRGIGHLGFSLLPPNSLGSAEHSGFLFVRQTFQCLQNLVIPEPPYLFGILLQKWEIPWAKTFPLRLLLRLGAEFRYYPCPLVGVRGRTPVYGEIGHTIMNLLADFHNYQYTLPIVPGLLIHMEDEKTIVKIPRRSYDHITKVLNSSDEHVMAFGATFSQLADSHLVCLQNDDGNYQTQAINIQNRPRKVTGACFIVFNGALKTSSGLIAKSSIIEDGIMVQISGESMSTLKQSLRNMKDYTIDCGPVEQTRPSEMVCIQWDDSPIKSNVGVRSPVDGMLLEDIPFTRINSATDYAGDDFAIRWTEMFCIKNEEEGGEESRTSRHYADQADVHRLADCIAQACCLALSSLLPQLYFESLTRIGLRVSIGTEQVGYEVGSLGARLPDVCMNNLDEKLIPVIHGAAAPGRPDLVLELIFHILQQKSTDRQQCSSNPSENAVPS